MLYNIYFSPTGGTKRVADLLARGLGESWTDIDLCDRKEDFSRFAFRAEDVCLISVPAYGGRVPAPALERLAAMTAGNASAILVAVFGNREIDDTLIELKDTLAAKGFGCVGAVAAIAEHSVIRAVATARPDTDDRKELADIAAQLRQKLEQGSRTEADVPGNRPYKIFGGAPLKPVANGNCTHCGLCEAQCPVGAIPEDDFTGVDKTKCISCLRCMEICPQHCRSIHPRPTAATYAKLSVLCRERKSNKLYIGQ